MGLINKEQAEAIVDTLVRSAHTVQYAGIGYLWHRDKAIEIIRNCVHAPEVEEKPKIYTNPEDWKFDKTVEINPNGGSEPIVREKPELKIPDGSYADRVDWFQRMEKRIEAVESEMKAFKTIEKSNTETWVEMVSELCKDD